MARPPRAAVRAQPRAVGADGALVRVPLDAAWWAEILPPVPSGGTVTVSFSDEDAAAEHGDAVRLLGYTVVGAVAGPTGQAAAGSDPPTADFLVSQALLEAHPAWWRALAGQASRTYSLLLGPVRMAVAEILDLHRPAPARRAGARPRPVQRQPPPRG